MNDFQIETKRTSTACSAPVVPSYGGDGASSCQVSNLTNRPTSSSYADKSGNDERGTPLFIDTETTGLDNKAEIVEIAIVDMDENIIFETLIKPSVPIPAQATAIHGITNDMVSSAPSFADVFNQVVEICSDKKLVFYNAAFDMRVIRQSLPESSHNVFLQVFGASHCLMLRYSNYICVSRWQTLINACEQQSIDISDVANHRASGDAIKTARLYKHMYKEGVKHGR